MLQGYCRYQATYYLSHWSPSAGYLNLTSEIMAYESRRTLSCRAECCTGGPAKGEQGRGV